MPATYTLINSNVLTSSQASVTFSSIPATYTDLVLRVSVRNDRGGDFGLAGIGLNNSAINISTTYLYSQYSTGVGQTGRDAAATTSGLGWVNSAFTTSNTFTSGEVYIPNYTSSATKQFSAALFVENNATASYGWNAAFFANSTAAINRIDITNIFGTNFVSGSSFYLYGISNA